MCCWCTRARCCSRRSTCDWSRSASSGSPLPRCAAGHEVRLLDLQVFPTSISVARSPHLATGRHRLLAQLPRQRPRGHRPRHGGQGGAPGRTATSGRGPQRVVHREELLAHAGGAHRLRRPRRRRGRSRPGCWRRSPAGGVWRPSPASLRRAASRSAAAADRRTSNDSAPGARALPQRRRSYFIGELDPCASDRVHPRLSVGLRRSAAPGRSMAAAIAPTPRGGGEDLASIRRAERLHRRRRGVHPRRARHGDRRRDRAARASASATTWRPRADVLLRNREVFARWPKLGLSYMFLGIEAIDEEGLKLPPQAGAAGATTSARSTSRASSDSYRRGQHHRRPRLGRAALRGRARVGARRPRDRAHDDQHAVPGHRDLAHRVAQLHEPRLSAVRRAACRPPDQLPLARFYEEFVATQHILSRKHLGFAAL